MDLAKLLWRQSWKSSAVVVLWMCALLAIGYAVYRLVDPLPPRRFAMAAGIPGTTYDDFARRYARILARDGITLELRNYDSSIHHFDALRDANSGVQAALTTFGFTQDGDEDKLYSLGGISDTPIFIFYKSAQPITLFSQLRGKRLSIGSPGTALRAMMLAVLDDTGALDASASLSDLDYDKAINALIAGEIDVAMLPAQADDTLLRRALGAPDVKLMNVAQAEAIAKKVPGLKHLVLWRGLISLPQDIPSSDMELLALRNRLLVRNDLHPALQYLLLKAMREVHWAPGPFNRHGEFPAEQPNDLPLSPAAVAFYRSGPTFLQQYTSFWLTSLLNRVIFFVIPIIAVLIPLIGFAPRIYTWLHIRPIGRLHRALGDLERELADYVDGEQVSACRTRLAEIETDVRSLKVARAFEADLQRLRIHLRMVQDVVKRIAAPS